MSHAILHLTPERIDDWRDQLVDLLIAVVEDGASVNFVRPMTRDKAAHWWDGALQSHALGERVIFLAIDEDRVDGTVHLVPAPMENQAHRADIAKMLIHPRARRRGLGSALLAAAEDEARRLGRTLLTLDTEKHSAGERLYRRMGWTAFGEVPGFAMRADGSALEAAVFFYKVVGG